MKVVQIVPGSGGTFYCQNCLRDSILVKRLRDMGHDVVMVPMYLPLFLDEDIVDPDTPVFYGAISVYLGQLVPWLRRLPQWLQGLLNSRALLRWAASKAGSTRARGLEEMTISTLKGEDGAQAAELEQLVSWLAAEGKPDVVQLSNALLLGLARSIKQRLDVPVVCCLQDEDTWIDAMEPQAADRAWSVMAERAADVDAFVAVSQYYADKMTPRLQVPPERMRVVHVGIDPDIYEPAAEPVNPPVIGFLSKLSPSLGLDTLIDAFIVLKQDPAFRNIKLRATGGMTGDDRPFLKRMRKRLSGLGFADDVEFLPEFGKTERLEFLRSLTVMCVPVPHGEAFGTFQIEAMAAGVPVVQPEVGAFPEVIALTEGGVTYEANTPEALAQALRGVLADSCAARALGMRGRQGVREHFSLDRMARRMLSVYDELAASQT